MREQLEGLPQRRFHVIGNFSEAFATVDSVAEKADAFHGAPLRVLYLSNIMFSKGFSYLIDAVKMLRADGHLVTLTLAGRPLSDSYMDAEESLARLKRALGEGVDYLGPVCGEQKWNLLEAAHMVALPTFYPTEAQPISLIEGMAFGCIPLTTHHNYNEDFLDPGAAIFVEKQNAKAIAEALRTLIVNPGDAAVRMRVASAIAIDRHCVKRFVGAIDRVLDSAVQRTAYCNAEKGGGQALFSEKSGSTH
jgi:glycosyltransferase involved in cell wall biosynthesis